jgi:DNA-binding MarR family transcriptional regulator
MTTNPFDVYLTMHSAWRDGIPKRLQGVEPSVLITILKLAEREEGISQSAVQSTLALTQWGLSKIKRKLVRENWVKVWRPTSDRRRLLMSATPKARLAMDTLESKLAATMKRTATPKAGQKGSHLRPPANAHSLFDVPIDDQ